MNWKKVDEIIRSYLGMKYYLVGIKLREEVKPEELSLSPTKPMAFCQMIIMSSQIGRTFVQCKEYEKCFAASVCLGFQEPLTYEIEPRIKPANTKSVLIAPLNKITEEPDVILAIINPRQMMDLTGVLLAGGQRALSVEFKANYACGDFIAKPIMEQRPNLSFFCNSARLYTKIREEDLIFAAPPMFYVQLAESMDRIVKVRGALCGCRISDIPLEIVHRLEEMGLSKSTDYFFGKIDDQDIRVYFNKDSQGIPKLLTVHLPIRMRSEEEAMNAMRVLESSLKKPFNVQRREYWLDISFTADEETLNVDLRTGMGLETAIKEIVHSLRDSLIRARIVNS